MFDVDQSIQDWKRSFRPDSSMGSDGIQEMEAHLRESVERLQGIGLSADEAFAIGLHRLGAIADLEAEFAKNQPVAAWRIRLQWMIAGYLAITLCYLGARASVAIAATGMAYAEIESTLAGPISVAVQVVAWACLLAISYRVLINREYAGNRFTWKWAVLIAVAIYSLAVVAAFGNMAQVMLADLSWYGESAAWLFWSAFVMRLGGYLLCLVAMCKLTGPAEKVVE